MIRDLILVSDRINLPRSIIALYFKNVVIRDDLEECWDWAGQKNQAGYGRMSTKIKPGSYKYFSAHRVSYWFHNELDPGDMFVLHNCSNPPCSNPYHLRLGTAEENARQASMERHCWAHKNPVAAKERAAHMRDLIKKRVFV